MHKGDWTVISAFGAGFTWYSMLVKWALDLKKVEPVEPVEPANEIGT